MGRLILRRGDGEPKLRMHGCHCCNGYGNTLAERVRLEGGQGEDKPVWVAVALFRAEGNGPACGALAGEALGRPLVGFPRKLANA